MYVITYLLANCYANYGSTNARELAAMLEAELVAGQDESFGERGEALLPPG